MPPSSRLPLRAWLIALVLAIALPLLALLSWIFVSQMRHDRTEARDTALRIAKASAEQIRLMHGESNLLLERLAARPAIRNPQPGTCDPLFAIVDFFPQYANVFLLDPEGRIVCSGPPQLQDRAISAAALRWLEQAARAETLRVGRPIILPIEGRWVSVLTRGVGSVESPAGTLALVQLPAIANEGALPPGSVVTIVDSEGTVVARTRDSDAWMGRNVRGAEVTEIVLTQPEGRTEARGVDGMLRQYGFTTIDPIDWHIYVGIPTAELMQPVWRSMRRGALFGMVIVLLVGIFAWRLSRIIEDPVENLSRAADRIGKEGFTSSVPVGGPREIHDLGERFNEMVGMRAAAESRIIESEQRLRGLSDRLLVIQEEERSRIAREIHDDLGQLLTALKMDVGGLIAAADAGSPISDPLRTRVESTLDRTVDSVQRIAAELRPGTLDDLGLLAALESEAALFEERTGIECELSLETGDLHLRKATEAAIYRILQEAMTNVARHADATRIEIRMRVREGSLILEVRDDGRGISESEIQARTSLGLIGIRERSGILGGSVHIEGFPGRGTIVSVRIPLSGDEETQT
ncbi:MAG: ATP-binding protein [Thermoanaerobaculia bacterium]